MKLAIWSAGLVLVAGSVAAQDWDGIEIKTTKLSDGLHVLHGAGGNIGVSSGQDGVLLVDDQFAR